MLLWQAGRRGLIFDTDSAEIAYDHLGSLSMSAADAKSTVVPRGVSQGIVANRSCIVSISQFGRKASSEVS